MMNQDPTKNALAHLHLSSSLLETSKDVVIECKTMTQRSRHLFEKETVRYRDINTNMGILVPKVYEAYHNMHESYGAFYGFAQDLAFDDPGKWQTLKFNVPPDYELARFTHFIPPDRAARKMDSQHIRDLLSRGFQQLDETILSTILNLTQINMKALNVLTGLMERYLKETDSGHRLDIKREMRVTMSSGNGIAENFYTVNDKFKQVNDSVRHLAGCIIVLDEKGIVTF